ncbi:MAG: DUF4878 domain-containing protein [Thermoanaerobaculia bacterium]
MRRRFTVLTACVCVIFALACAGNSPASAVKSFYKAIGDGKTEDALTLLSQRTISMVGKDKLRTGLQKATRDALDKGGITDVQITNEQVANEIASVTAIVKYGNGTAQTEKIQLVKEGTGWRLQPEK